MNDFELLYLAQECNEEAYNELYNKYNPLMENYRKKYSLVNKNKIKDNEDIKIDIMVTFNNCVNSYREDSGILFYTYLINSMENTIKGHYRRLKLFNFENEMISLDEETKAGLPAISLLKASSYLPEECLDNTVEEDIVDMFYEKLSSQEKIVFSLRLGGYSFKEIARELNIEVKKIYSTFERIKSKWLRENKLVSKYD